MEVAPSNAACWSNRGTARLQAGRWAGAAADLARAVELDPGDALTRTNWGNALGAVGAWPAALAQYRAAARSRDGRVAPLARANEALALFQTGDGAAALAAARALLRRDPEAWDARAMATAFLWASGDEGAAEASWTALCQSGRGFGGPRSAEPQPGEDATAGAYAVRLLQQQFAQQAAIVAGAVRRAGDGDDTPCALYRSVARVSGRWPPRATAALDAFLKLSRQGEARGYDGVMRTYSFADAAAVPPAS